MLYLLKEKDLPINFELEFFQLTISVSKKDW